LPDGGRKVGEQNGITTDGPIVERLDEDVHHVGRQGGEADKGESAEQPYRSSIAPLCLLILLEAV